ncbi:hypothetical protein HYW35_03720 [Candidatus Saccharibacteria bacterium]|nr:hypothetical protein [Candidatus Saccharibacteria bacterium]
MSTLPIEVLRGETNGLRLGDPAPRILPGERILSIVYPGISYPKEHPPATVVLMQLTGVKKPEDIGNNGPSIAATASAENEHIEILNNLKALYGRDSLIVGNYVSGIFPKLQQATVIRLAELQGIDYNSLAEEEPGRIIHEDRPPDSPIAVQATEKSGWQWPYYGSIDATPLFISATIDCTKNEILFLKRRFEGRDGKTHTLEESLENSVGWLMRKLDSNQESLLEFKPSFDGSIENQAWKDSWDSYFHKDGTIANHRQGIASVEVQAFAYDALLDVVEFYNSRLEAITDPSEKSVLQQKIEGLQLRADKLKRTVMDKFWVEDERGGYFALGTDRDEDGKLRPLEIRTSNMGYLLDSRMLDSNDPEIVRRREEVIKTLFSEEMLAEAGIRTLSNREVRFRSGAYHNGSVWPHDTYRISRGLAKCGYYGLAYDLVQRIKGVVEKTNMYVEFARGGESGDEPINRRIVDVWDEKLSRENRIEEPPKEPQAWDVAANVAIDYFYNSSSPKKALPTQATDPAKQLFEEAILSQIHRSYPHPERLLAG